MKFKDNLRKQRIKVRLSQERLAEKMSVSRQTVSKWENGEAYPSTKHILMLARILGCGVNELVGNEPSDENKRLATNTENRQPATDDEHLTNSAHITLHRRCVYWVIGIAAVCLVTVLMLSIFAGYGTSGAEIDNFKAAVFDSIVDGSLDEAMAADGYTGKIVGYGIDAANGAFYVKCDLYGGGVGSPCSAIIYFCENDGDYVYECRYLDDPEYWPEGEYYEVG